jgi:hypothetical protein
MGCCKTKIIQVLGGGAGGGPYVVAPNTPTAGQTTVTDTASGNSFIVPDASLYNFDGSLSGNRVVDMAGFDLTFQNGGDFIIDGKLTVTGMIDPIGLQLTESNTTAVGATGAGKATLYSSDGTDGQTQNHPIWKDDTGVLHDLLAGGSNIYTADGTLLANRTLTGAGFDLTFDGVNNFLADAVASSKLQVETSVTHAAFIDVQPDFVWMSAQQASDGSSVSVISTPGFQTVALSFGATADLTINGDQGTAGQVITSQGPNLPPIWSAGAGGSILTANFTQTAARVQDFGAQSQTWNNMGAFTRNVIDATEAANYTSGFLPTVSAVYNANAAGISLTANNGPGSRQVSVNGSTAILVGNDGGGNEAGFKVQTGGVGPALGVPQPFIITQAVDSGAAVVGQVLTLSALTGEVEFQTAAGGSNIYTVDGTITGNRTLTTGANTLTFQAGLGTFSVQTANQTQLHNSGGSSWARNVFIVNPGSTNFNIDNSGVRLDRTHTGVAISSVAVEAGVAFLRCLNSAGTDGTEINTRTDAIRMAFTGSSDLRINGSAGNFGEVLSSTGLGSAPIWTPVFSGGGMGRLGFANSPANVVGVVGGAFGALAVTATVDWSVIQTPTMIIPSAIAINGNDQGVTYATNDTINIAASTNKAYSIDYNCTVSHSVSSATMFVQLVDTTTNTIIDVASASCNGVGEMVNLTLMGIDNPTGAAKSYQVRVGSTLTGTLAVHKATARVVRIA